MERLVTDRLTLRPFHEGDWKQLLSLAENWVLAPGPDFDKWPTDEAGIRSFASFLAEATEQYLAVLVSCNNRLIGLIALNPVPECSCVDLGHVFLSGMQQNDLDLEAIQCVVDQVFQRSSVDCIEAHNAAHAPQLAPLLSLGFKQSVGGTPGELMLTRAEYAGRVHG